MKKVYALLMALMLTIAAEAQTLNVTEGNVTYLFPASQTGEMTFNNGETITIMGKTFTLNNISMKTDDTSVTDNLVAVEYNGSSATVLVAGNVAQYVSPTISGAHVTITQSNTDAVNDDEITYQLSGTTTDGSLTLGGSYKCTLSLEGVTLTNPSGAAINITNSKRIQISAKKNTTNTLTDGAGGSQKACVYSKGQIQFQGNGVLNVVGKAKHAIKSGDYITIKNLTLNITSALDDGISCNEYFLMKSGVVTISGVSDDGIQCDIDGTTSTGETTDHEDEDSGNLYLEGGTLNITVTADAAKGVKGEGDMKISGGDITIKTTGGGVWDSDNSKTKASACLGADGNMVISGGTLSLTSTGNGGKGISTDGTMTISDGTITINTSGQAVGASSSGVLTTISDNQTLDRYNSDLKSSPKGIKADGNMLISGGTITVTTTGCGGEGIESKGTQDITGGHITVNAYDDGINSSSHMTISGGYVFSVGSKNDGIDANGNLYIKGGLVYAIGSGGAEKSIDANTEDSYKLYIQGGTVIAVGDLENNASISGGTCKYTTSWTASSWYALYNGSELVAVFKTPTKSTSGGGGPGGGSSSQKLIVYTSSTPTLKSGVTVSDGTTYFGGMANIGGTVSNGTNVTLSTYSSSSGGGGRW